MFDLLIYFVAGVAVGLGSGLFGIGGGLIVVPVLLPVFAAQGLGTDVAMHVAVASSLATIVVTTASSARAHWKLGNIVGRALPWLISGLVVGSFAGAQIAAAVPGRALQIIFGAFVILLAVRMALVGQVPPGRVMPPPPVVTGVGGVIGTIAGMVGIGGGALIVPFLAWTGVEMRKAVGTSAASNVCVAIAGTLGFIVAGVGEAGLPDWSTGYIYWPAVGGITLASVFTAPLGAKLASRLPAQVLRRAFAAFLVVVGLKMLVG
ncbi:sulfite exporter TauE/SafE family protein [Spiribacter salinus]|uniref:sulfite exporter TauE/SafE family protein n=1 Tax=Spiribacter salinus TaxID=1335746 RepID=UPI001C967A9A|nr:sulfite exporter TauE/SafE family protein [Spiribacter salinus]MBY5268549.1 hypothetical protein [Spiribacter salinus]